MSRHYFFKILFLLPLISFSGQPEKIQIPEGNGEAVLVDGIMNEEEWNDSKQVFIAENAALNLKQSENYLFIGIKTPFEMLPYIDMFIETDDKKIYNIHASFQLGERDLTGLENWDDNNPTTRWGYTSMWYANEIRQDRSKRNEESIYYYDGFEFQISKDKFQSENIKLRVEVRPAKEGHEEIYYPENSGRKNPDGWLILQF